MHKHLSDAGIDWMQKSYALFPDWSTEQRIRWAKAKEYVTGRFTIPIGERVVDHTPPDFLRALPRPEFLTVERPRVSEYLRELRRIVEGKMT